ncbi:MAG: hypothetical protein WBJ29_06430 [Fervidobacterium sp.]
MTIIRSRAFVVLIILFSTIVFSWSGHSTYTFLVIKHLKIDLNFLVEVHPKDFEEERVYNTTGMLGEYLENDISGQDIPNLINKDLLLKYGSINSKSIDGKLPAWQIISLYSSFPDIGIDYLKDVSWIQNIFLGNSQALRHSKIKVRPVEVFEGDQSFLYFAKKSSKLLKEGNEYWGLRYLGYALHYLEDLMQPYHTRPGTVWELVRYPFDKNIRILLRNAHTAYDNMMVYLILYDEDKLENVISNAKPIYFSSYEQLIYEAYMYSHSQFFKVHEMVKNVFSDILYDYAPTMTDFTRLAQQGKLNDLVEETYRIISTMSSVIKGFIGIHLVASCSNHFTFSPQ